MLRFVGKTVILVDDGVATGQTFVAAAETIRKQLGALRTIGAVPVCSKDRVARVRQSVDELIVPEDLSAVGEFYDDFSRLPDDEVIEILRDANPGVSHVNTKRQCGVRRSWGFCRRLFDARFAKAQANTTSTGRLRDRGMVGPRPKRTTRSGRCGPTPSHDPNCGRIVLTSTGWFRNALRMPNAVACNAKR